MNKKQLFENIKRKKSFLCIDLDTDMEKIPSHLKQEEDPIFTFRSFSRLSSALNPIIWLSTETLMGLDR